MYTVYAKRRGKLIELMASQGIEKVVVGRPHNIYYLSGIMINPYERFLALTIDAGDRSCNLIAPSLEMGAVKDPGIKEVLHRDEQDAIAILAEVLGPTDLLGMDMDYFSMASGERIRQQLKKASILDITRVMEGLRSHKDSEEIDRLQTAAKCADQVLAEIKQNLQPGHSEKEIFFEIFKSMSAKPKVVCNELIILVLSGENSANPHGEAGTRKFEKGDPITIDFGLYAANYWADITRTFYLGKPAPEMEKIYKITLEAQMKAIAEIRPGVPIRNIDLAARRVIENVGYGEYFLHRTGHGLGLSIHEKPTISSDNEAVLEEGNVFTVEPGIYIPNMGGVRIEEDVIVTNNGCRILTSYPKQFEDMIL